MCVYYPLQSHNNVHHIHIIILVIHFDNITLLHHMMVTFIFRLY